VFKLAPAIEHPLQKAFNMLLCLYHDVIVQVCCPKAGEELTISYGEKGNEELLLLYGFALPQNPAETLMLLCPMPPPGDWDDLFAARMQLMQVSGRCRCAPAWFLVLVRQAPFP